MPMMRNEMGEVVCCFCGKAYKPRYDSYEAAMATDDMEAREQWISGCCSDACWDEALGPEGEED